MTFAFLMLTVFNTAGGRHLLAFLLSFVFCCRASAMLLPWSSGKSTSSPVIWPKRAVYLNWNMEILLANETRREIWGKFLGNISLLLKWNRQEERVGVSTSGPWYEGPWGPRPFVGAGESLDDRVLTQRKAERKMRTTQTPHGDQSLDEPTWKPSPFIT